MLLPQVVVQMSTTDAMSTTNVSKTIPYHLYHLITLIEVLMTIKIIITIIEVISILIKQVPHH